MQRTHGSQYSGGSTLPVIFLTTSAWILLATVPSWAGGASAPSPLPQVQNLPSTQTQIPTEPEKESGPTRSSKQKRELLKANFQKMKDNAEELATEATALREALEKSNADVLSLDIVQRAEKIEKLAKKIKAGAKGY